MGNGWVWVRLPVFAEGDVIVDISLGFHRGRLEQIALTDAHAQYGTNWNDASEKQERLRAVSIGNWLAAKGFPASRYAWGSVEAGYDAKSCSGSASVRFHHHTVRS